MPHTIRPATPDDAPGIARVHVATWRTAYDGILDPSFLALLSTDSRTNMWREILTTPDHTTAVHVAESAGDITGFVAAGPEREQDPDYRGEVYAIYVLAECQGEGIGRRLWDAAVDGLAQRGLAGTLVWVLRDNPSRRFYEAIGGQFVREKKITIGDQTLAEFAYGWPA